MKNANNSIVILTSHSWVNYSLINQLKQEFSIDFIIYAKQGLGSKLKLLKSHLKKLGFWKVIGQVLFLFLDALYIRPTSEAKVRQLFSASNTSQPDISSITVDDINGSEVQKLLSKIKPKVVVVAGTSILRPRILALAKTFINIHVGITPAYRGVHGGFWALYNKDFQNIGVTIHLLDTGVDTGSILYQAPVELDSSFDTFRTIPVKQYLKGTELMRKAVRDALTGNLKPVVLKKGESRQWFHPTIVEYLRGMRILRRL